MRAKVQQGTVFTCVLKKNIMKSYLGLLLAGVIIGILVAPERGSATRRKLRNAFTDAQDGLNRLAYKATDKVEALAEKVDAKIQGSV